MKRIKQILAAALAMLTIISSIPTQAHAEVTNTAGNTGGGSVKHGAGSEYMGWFRQTRGFRMYIVNKNLERITPVYDFSGLGSMKRIKMYLCNRQ